MHVKSLLICFLFLALASTAQNNLIILDEAGQKFILFVDDRQVNDSAQSQVEATGIYDDTCRIRAVFSQRAIPEFSTKVYLEQSKKPVSKRDFTYSIIEEKGKRKLKFISVNETLSDTNAKPIAVEKKIAGIFSDREKEKDALDRLHENYPPPPCGKAVTDTLLAQTIRALRNEHIALNRMKNAKWFVSHYCLMTGQMAQILATFDYETHKEKLAEFYYDYLLEKDNFLELLSSLKYSTEKEALKTFYRKKTETK